MSTERRRDPDHSWDEFWGNMGLGSLLTRTIECPHGVEQCLGKTVGIAFSLSWDYFCTQPVFCITALQAHRDPAPHWTQSPLSESCSWHKPRAASWSSVQDLPGTERKSSTCLLYRHKQETVKDSPCAVRILLWAFWNKNNYWNVLFLFFLLTRIVIWGIFCYPQNV